MMPDQTKPAMLLDLEQENRLEVALIQDTGMADSGLFTESGPRFGAALSLGEAWR